MSGLSREKRAEAGPKSVWSGVGGGLNIWRGVGWGLDGSGFADELGGTGVGAGGAARDVAEDFELFGDSQFGGVVEVKLNFGFTVPFPGETVFEGVREVKAGEWGEFRGEFAGGQVMACDCFNYFRGQSPKREQVGAGFCVGGAESLPFHLPGWEFLFAAEIQGIAIGLLQVHGESEFADVVEEGGGISVMRKGFVLCDEVCEGPGGVGDALAMFPNLVGGEVNQLHVIKPGESLDAENESGGGFHSHEQDGVRRRGDGPSKSKEGGIGDLEQFAGNGQVTRDQFANGL